MRKKKFIYIILIILLLGCIIVGCKQKEDEETDKSEAQSVPTALEQVQQQSDEIVTSTMAKDWAGSLVIVKELQSKWSDLYPDIQKQGAKQEDVDAFVAGLNTLTDYLISKTLNLPQEPSQEEKKDEQSPGQEQEAQQSPGQEQEAEQSPGQEQEDQQASEGENKEESGEQESQGKEDTQDTQDTEEKKDPKEVLNKLDPIISASQEDLVIINSSIEVTKYIPKFMSLFESPVPPDLFKLKYLVRHLHVASKLEDWDIVSADFKNVMETWESVQSEVLKVDADLKTQLVQSIDELEDVVNSKNVNLTGVKCNFIVEQIESLTKTMKEQEETKEEDEKKS